MANADDRNDANRVDFPFKELLGFEIEHGEGECRADITLGDEHLNPNGVVHGAVPYALVDTAMGGATMSVLEEGLACATIEIQIRYLAAARGQHLHATAKVRKAGRRIVHLDASVVDDGGREVAAATGSFAVLDLRAG